MKKQYTTLAFALLLGMSFTFAESMEHPTKNIDRNTHLANIPVDTVDVQPPVLTCLNGLSVNIMPTGKVTLWDADFVVSAADNETPVNQIRFGIRKAGTGSGFPMNPMGNPSSSITFDCAELGTQSIELWAIDLAGNADFCTTSLQVLDNNMNCSNNGGGKICLKQYCNNEFIPEVNLHIISDTLSSNPSFSFFQLSNDQACNDVPSFVPIDSNYYVTFSKDDQPLNGVTVYDIQIISNHIQGIQPFTEPWQWVAADANQDNLVDAKDILELNNLMLGISQNLPNEASWRFVRSNYVFPSPNPLSQPFPEILRIDDLQNGNDVLFLGIKIGDLSVNCQPQTPVTTPSNAANFYAAANPNPTAAGAELRVYIEQSTTGRLQIRDISGKLSFDAQVQLAPGRQSLEIPEMALVMPGMYFWSLEISGKIASGKIIKM